MGSWFDLLLKELELSGEGVCIFPLTLENGLNSPHANFYCFLQAIKIKFSLYFYMVQIHTNQVPIKKSVPFLVN